MLQVTGYKFTKKRVFRMAPIHHHFDLGGWAETAITIRFWIFVGHDDRARARPLLRHVHHPRRHRLMTTYLVAGLARTGQSVIRMAQRDGDDVIGYDDNEATAARVGEEFGLARVGSTASVRRRRDARRRRSDRQPWLPAGAPRCAPPPTAAGKRIIGDVELAARRTRTPFVAVTGTNGKSTVVRLITEMLVAGGHKAVETGNVGFPILDAIEEPAEYYVVEVSSFQLADTRDLPPRGRRLDEPDARSSRLASRASSTTSAPRRRSSPTRPKPTSRWSTPRTKIVMAARHFIASRAGHLRYRGWRRARRRRAAARPARRRSRRASPTWRVRSRTSWPTG